jgi:hypothetical protein
MFKKRKTFKLTSIRARNCPLFPLKLSENKEKKNKSCSLYLKDISLVKLAVFYVKSIAL